MLTRLCVNGFKNLVDVDIRFGAFTCIAGANGVGKSNLLDAILFLSRLSDVPLIEAALSVRDQGAKSGDIRGLFHHVGDHFDEEMSFVAEMIIAPTGMDDLGQDAKANSTFLNYSLRLRYRQDQTALSLGSLEIIKEELTHITVKDAKSHLAFPHSTAWSDGAVINKRRGNFYISTEDDGRFIKLYQDGGSSGRPQKLLAASLPRTVLSAATAAESPTATLVKREMQSWRLLQLEPSALREPDNFTAPIEMASDGAHLPAALYHRARHAVNGEPDEAQVYTELANRLSQLIDDVKSIYVDRDERRQLLTAYVCGRDGTTYPARALSDGTLRFLALAVLSIDRNPRGVICMEEPENGIHPERLPAMIQLLEDLTTDPEDNEPDAGKWIRQVIINTHSPAVVMQVPDNSLVVAESVETIANGRSFKSLKFRSLPDTWRAPNNNMKAVPKGRLLPYLNPVSQVDWTPSDKRSRRVIDREDLSQYKLDLYGQTE